MEVNDLMKQRSMRARLSANRWYSIKNQAGPVAELMIYDEIWWGGVNAEEFARDLNAITAPEILVRLNSPGGDVFDSIAIYNALRSHAAAITTRVEGVAASGASIIVQAGTKRLMMSGAQMMIHEPWGVAIGPASEIREFADLLDRQTDVLANIYASRSGKDAEEFRSLMAGGSDIWMSAQETLEAGLADEILNPQPNSEQENPQNKRLIDEVQETVDAVSAVISSAEQVSAIRAEKGKTLSKINAEGLAGLQAQIERLQALLAADEPEELDAVLQREHLRLLAG